MRRVPTAIALGVALAGCAALLPQPQYDESMRASMAMQEQSNQAAVAMMANQRADRFVVGDEAWFCPDRAAAKLGKRCAGGTRYTRNREVKVIGAAPEDGLWRSEVYQGNETQAGFVAASALAELPELAHLEKFAADTSERYSEADRIPTVSVNFIELLERRSRFAGKVLVIQAESSGMTNKEFARGVFRFTIPIPFATDGRLSALAQFELRSSKVVDEFNAGNRSYRCGPAYCDVFVVVAKLTGRTVDRVGEGGFVFRLPVFEVVEMADRYGVERGAR